MSLSAGTRLGPYDIVAPLGAGGMGEVYRATDTRLKRQVAVKILPPALAADPDRLARFQREAEVLASLNHGRIAGIYGLEEADGVKALVMELVEGPTLADRIAEGPIPIAEALPIASQIAEALEAAHEQGIIHRDLKPANIKVRDDGAVKVLDFGLAKLAEPRAVSRVRPDESPTLTGLTAMTSVGMILGTAAYMSPEQARGRAVDKRTDMWAFGAVLYEMLTGRRAFRSSGTTGEAETTTDLIAAVLTSTPDWTALPASVPPHIVTLIQRCLDKDRATRIGDMAVARFLLSGQATGIAAPAATIAPAADAPPPRARRMPNVLAAVAAATLVGVMIGWFLPRRATNAPQPPTHLQMNVLPADRVVGSIASVRPSRTAMALAPDGRLVVFSATRGAVTQLYARGLDRGEATPVHGTEGGFAPFFSPDGAWIAFWVGTTIKKVPVSGGPAVTIADLLGPSWGATWSDDDTIYVAGRAGISRASPAGGTPIAITAPERGEQLGLPHALPGGQALLFTVATSRDWAKANVSLLSLQTGERRVLIEGAADARYVSSGHLVFLKSGTLMAVGFDRALQRLVGEPAPLIENVMQAINQPNGSDETGAGQFAISRSGTLMYVLGGLAPSLLSRWTWLDRAGVDHGPTAAPLGTYVFPQLSPDGQRVAVTVRNAATRTSDLWVYDVRRAAPIRLTFDGSGGPIWSADGKRLAYGGSTDGVTNLFVINADGGGQPERLTTSESAQTPSSWASTTNTIAFLQRPTPDTYGIWGLPMDGERTPRLFLESRFTLTHAELSPDGRWMAYVSTESGTQEVYVQPYPGPGEKIRISTTGGTEPIWTANGRELLYRFNGSDAQQYFSAGVRSVAPFQTDVPRLLFDVKNPGFDSTTPIRSWSISPDGQRFLLSRFEFNDPPVTSMYVVLNWADELRRLVK